MVADHDETIIADFTDSKSSQQTKSNQLAGARIKALESRRRTQKMRLERLHQVKMLLGELDPEQQQRAMSAMISQETSRCQELIEQFTASMRAEFKKCTDQTASLKRHVDTVKEDVVQLSRKLTHKGVISHDTRPTVQASNLSSISSVSTLPSIRSSSNASQVSSACQVSQRSSKHNQHSQNVPSHRS